MPRPKVAPEARKRVAQACQQCKASKRKCNASRPCNQCVKRGSADTCDNSDVEDSNRRSSMSTSHATRQRTNTLVSDQSAIDNSDANGSSNDAPLSDVAHHHSQPTSGVANQEVLYESSPDTTRANMLSNNAGEYVFVGRSASLSFLQLMRETFVRCIGPCEFSEHVSRDQMLEMDLASNAGADQEIALDSLQKQHCTEYYLLATTGLIDIISPEEAAELLDNRMENNSYLAAKRLLVIAIGSQAGPFTRADGDHIEKRAFTQARTMMFTSMLENPNIDMIQAFLLLSFYMLGACHRNAAFLYLGIAARAAHTLGLHTAESYAVLDEHRRYAQLKCWKSLVSLDLMVSSVLGRITAILAQRSNADAVVKITDRIGNHPSSELEAVYRLSLLVDLISSQFNGSEPVTVETAQSHLQSLKDWSGMLPSKLRPSAVPVDSTSQTRQSLLGCMHISCFYYFAVMLATRPFLIVHITRKLFRRKEHLYQTAITNSDDAEELASACLSAATYMAQTCAALQDFNLLIENMCLLKAWIFAAGLVLGFEMFADHIPGKGIEQAFGSCCRVLQKLATRSPQASQYYEILTLLSSAVDRHRQIQKSRKSQGAGSLVARIMDLKAVNGPRMPAIHNETSPMAFQDQPVDGFQAPLLNNGLNGGLEIFHNGMDDLNAGLDDFPIPSPDSFMFDLQSFGMMPWGLS